MNKLLLSISAAVVFLSLSWGAYADISPADMSAYPNTTFIAQNLPPAYNDTFNQNQAALLKALPFSVFYFPLGDSFLSLGEVAVTAEGPYCTYKLTYFTIDGGQFTVEGCNGGIGDIPQKSGFNVYTVKTPNGKGTAYLKASSVKNKAVFYSQWLECKPQTYCRISAENVPDKYIKGIAAYLTELQ